MLEKSKTGWRTFIPVFLLLSCDAPALASAVLVGFRSLNGRNKTNDCLSVVCLLRSRVNRLGDNRSVVFRKDSGPAPAAQVVDEQTRYFHCSEMPPLDEVTPARQVVHQLGTAAWRYRSQRVATAGSEVGRCLAASTRRQNGEAVPDHARIEPGGASEAAGHDIEADVGQQALEAEYRLEGALTQVGPVMEAFENP